MFVEILVNLIKIKRYIGMLNDAPINSVSRHRTDTFGNCFDDPLKLRQLTDLNFK